MRPCLGAFHSIHSGATTMRIEAPNKPAIRRMTLPGNSVVTVLGHRRPSRHRCRRRLLLLPLFDCWKPNKNINRLDRFSRACSWRRVVNGWMD